MGLEEANRSGDDRAAVVADAVREMYGSDAISVALRQVDAAEGSAREDWIAILEILRR